MRSIGLCVRTSTGTVTPPRKASIGRASRIRKSWGEVGLCPVITACVCKVYVYVGLTPAGPCSMIIVWWSPMRGFLYLEGCLYTYTYHCPRTVHRGESRSRASEDVTGLIPIACSTDVGQSLSRHFIPRARVAPHPPDQQGPRPSEAKQKQSKARHGRDWQRLSPDSFEHRCAR